MAYTLWSQDIFTKGELSPYMYARCSVNEYYNGLKTAQNVLTYPTGAAGKRFGTIYEATLTTVTEEKKLYFKTFQYLNECVYQIVITENDLSIYLEGIAVNSPLFVISPAQAEALNSTVIGDTFRMTSINGFRPLELVRSSNVAATVLSFTANTYTVALTVTPFNAGVIYPVRFTATGGTIMQTSPGIVPEATYFVVGLSSTQGVLFATPEAAKRFVRTGEYGENFTINSLGTGTTSSFTQNFWTVRNVEYVNLPTYDFNGNTVSYDAITFTPSAVDGVGVTITLSAPYAPLNSSYIGGSFIGGGATARITAVPDTSHITVNVQDRFGDLNPISGALVFLSEPAWSDIRGWPQVCSSYQNRALFANTASLPNGFWGSVTNNYADFGDLTTDDDDSISWFPSSNNVNYIKFIVPYRSITVHTNTGIYSSPLSDVAAITPNNFSLQLQDSTPANQVQPVSVDNQILVLTGNHAHQMLWDGINNAYTSNIVSVISEHLIRTPVDEIGFNDLKSAGSRYVFIINEDGSMTTYQTLISQSVMGFTPQIATQHYGNAYFKRGASSSDGRVWFVVKREIAGALSPVSITGFTDNTLHAVGTSFDTTVPTAVKFITSGTLPSSSPQVAIDKYYWAIGVDADNFKLYLTQADALADEDGITFSSSGTSSSIEPWPLKTIFTLEELTFDTYLDCATPYNGSPVSTVPTGELYNAQTIKMVGDGFGFESLAENNVDNEVKFEAHGIPTTVSQAYIGFPIQTIIEPMPLSISMGNSAKETTLGKPKRINFVRFMFNNTIGGTINGIPIALTPFDQVSIGEPPVPARGIFEMSIMRGWDDFNNPTYTIEHDEPFNIQLLGAFYSVEF